MHGHDCVHTNANNTVNMPDPIQERFGYGRYTSSQCAATVRLDYISRIRLPAFVWSILQRRPESYCAKVAWIQSGWPGQVWAKWIWCFFWLQCDVAFRCFARSWCVWLFIIPLLGFNMLPYQMLLLGYDMCDVAFRYFAGLSLSLIHI